MVFCSSSILSPIDINGEDWEAVEEGREEGGEVGESDIEAELPKRLNALGGPLNLNTITRSA